MITIRKTKNSDIKTLASIYEQTYNAEKTGEFWDTSKAKALLDFYFNLKTFIGLTALSDKKICGAFFSFIKPWWDGKHLAEGELFIHPKYQNKGIGTQLYLVMMKTAYKRGCIVHDLRAYKKPATWYKKIGFKRTSLAHLSGQIKEVILLINSQNRKIKNRAPLS